jgi:hypothetical protein
MKIITQAEFAKATGLDKLHMPGLEALLMEITKVNRFNEMITHGQPKQGVEFVHAGRRRFYSHC